MLALLALAGAALSACTPTPEPSPTPTAVFASEEEAFAAAEEVYRAYLEAAAARADGDETAEPEQYLSGQALESDLESQRTLASEGIRISGATEIVEFAPAQANLVDSIATLRADLCLDISKSRVLDANGVDVTPLDRPDRGQITVEFSGDANQLLISQSSPAENSPC